MEIMSNIYDYRIKSTNLYVETTFGEYLQYAKDLIKNNDLQKHLKQYTHCLKKICWMVV